MIIINDATRLFLYNSNARALQRNEPTTILIADRQKQPQTSIVRKAASSAMPVKVFVSVIFKALCIGDLLSRSFYSSGPRTALFIVLILTNPSQQKKRTRHTATPRSSFGQMTLSSHSIELCGRDVIT